MKNPLFALLVFMLGVTVCAQNSVEEWQAKAVEKYPPLGLAGSDFNNAFLAEYERRKQAAPELFRVVDWPMQIADAVDSELRLANEKGPFPRGLADAKTPETPRQGSSNSDGLLPIPPGFELVEDPVPASPPRTTPQTLSDRDFQQLWDAAPGPNEATGSQRPAAERLAVTKWETVLRWAALAAVALALVSLIVWGARILAKSGRTARLLCAFRAFLDRIITAKSIVLLVAFGLIASWVFPPGYDPDGYGRGWAFLFNLDSDLRIDFERLILVDAIIAAVGGMLAWVASGKSHSRSIFVQLAFYSLVAVPIIALVSGAAFLTMSVIPLAESWANQPWKSASKAAEQRRAEALYSLTKADTADVLLDRISEARKAGCDDASIFDLISATMDFTAVGQFNNLAELDALLRKPKFDPASAMPEAWLPPDAKAAKRDVFDVVADDPNAPNLKQLTLFDVGLELSYDRTSVSNIHGRVRSRLPQAVKNLMLKASFYNAQKQLLAVEKFVLHETVSHDVPVSFDKSGIGVRHLPDGWTWQFEIIEAHYVK